jgi:hypothetical protein
MILTKAVTNSHHTEAHPSLITELLPKVAMAVRHIQTKATMPVLDTIHRDRHHLVLEATMIKALHRQDGRVDRHHLDNIRSSRLTVGVEGILAKAIRAVDMGVATRFYFVSVSYLECSFISFLWWG